MALVGINIEIPNGGKTATSIQEARQAMGIDWAIWSELVEAIPPHFTEWIGRQLSTDDAQPVQHADE